MGKPEHSIINTGFLAVAATVCDHQEKTALFNNLKAREDNMLRLSVQGAPGSEISSARRPIVRTTTDQLKQSSYPKGVGDHRSDIVFDVMLDKKRNDSLGV